MPKLTMTKGLPASGKSTWAKAQCMATNGQTKRVNKDDLRAMLDAGEWSKHNEKTILAVRNLLVVYLLQQGFNVIVDDTNLQPPHEPTLREIAKANGATFAVQDFTDVDVDTCVRRDLERDASVGEKVIRDMWKRYLYTPPPEPETPEYLHDAPRAIIIDIDGTVAKMVSRGPFDYDRVSEDVPKGQVIDVIYMWLRDRLNYHERFHLIFCSGRPETCRADTEAWLKKHVFTPMAIIGSDWTLHMRPEFLPTGRESDAKQVRDFRKDSIVKKEIYDRHIKGRYNIDFVLDDRNQVVEMWRAQGLLCLQVADGNF